MQYVNKACPFIIKDCAIIINSMVHYKIVEVLITQSRELFEVKMFLEEEEAAQWLKERSGMKVYLN
ncbi:MAG: hypothetical protein HRT71_10065 [Flavobacteriales bacterium]|nr:hypothetical protein [Flavobacteriales bacterium]